MTKKIPVALAGASGYSGAELLRLLKAHPFFEVKHLIGRETQMKDLKGQVELAFLATPHETSVEMARELISLDISVVDLSGAFRLKKHAYKDWYAFEHTEIELLQKSEFGLYPWNKISPRKASESARLISNPGCYSTAVMMGLIPLLKEKIILPSSIFIDAKSGTTGAGKKASQDLLFSEIAENFKPYKVGRHQHWPEIKEYVEAYSGASVSPSFITELLPIQRGISVAIFSEWARELQNPKVECLLEAYKKHYSDHHDIRVGREDELSVLKNVVHSNRIHIQVNEAFSKPLVFVSIDNLLRGAAGQALMNANQWAGFPALEGIYD